MEEASTSNAKVRDTATGTAGRNHHSLTCVCSHSLQTSAHLAMTYTALLNLAILRDDFSRLNREGLIDFVASCQQPDGR